MTSTRALHQSVSVITQILCCAAIPSGLYLRAACHVSRCAPPSRTCRCLTDRTHGAYSLPIVFALVRSQYSCCACSCNAHTRQFLLQVLEVFVSERVHTSQCASLSVPCISSVPCSLYMRFGSRGSTDVLFVRSGVSEWVVSVSGGRPYVHLVAILLHQVSTGEFRCNV